MKYIVCLLEGKEVIFVFPRAIDHDRFYEGLAAIRFGHNNWRRHVLGCPSDLVSAGFITNGTCHGYSETLSIGSRNAVDSKLLEHLK
jgi:hypothetical protein